MEKLIELLNEHLKTFDTETNKTLKVFAFEEATKSFLARNGVSYRQERVISKRFEFIKWLLDNGKIETNNLSLKAFKNIFGGGGFVEVPDLEVLLMLLSISDTPIEDLISYLNL